MGLFFIAFIVFSKKSGYYYKSFKRPASSREVKPSNKWIKLDDIQALQIIKERIKTKNSSYNSYEINLVLQDTRRITVIDHKNYLHIKADAKQIADFIGVPYWDGVHMSTYEPTNLRQSVDLDSNYDSTRARFREM